MPEDSPNVAVEQVESEPQDTEATKSLDEIAFDDFVPGKYAPFDYSPKPFAKLDDEQKRVLRELVILKSRTDVASRRFEVEQCWEGRLFPRGYQHLLPRRGGGWSLPGEKTVWGPLATADSAALYSTNTIGRDTDILCAAIAREVPKIEFFPRNPEDPSSTRASDAANKYKYIYEKTSCLREKLMDLALLYCSDDRAVLYTRHVKDAEAYGVDETGKPRGAEITSIHGKLEHKVPMQVQEQREMDSIQIFTELDISTARAKYSWIADKIKPGSPGIGEIELDMIARVNTRLALLGSYVTGDAMQRDVTEQMTWLRPAAFFDDTIKKEMRESLLELFPTGALVVYCGQELCFAREEALDDHLKVTHALPGIGQNRRALMSSSIPPQKRLNAWIDLMDAFFRRTVPRRHYAAGVFDIEALQAQDNTPGKSSPFELQPGVSVDQLCWIEPTPTHQPAMPDFIQSFFGTVPASLSGASDSLFNATAGDDPGPTPVGTVKIQRDQALARAGLAWNAAKGAFAESARQAVHCAAECRENETISDFIPGQGAITIQANDLKGNVLCYPEYDAAFPEAWPEREQRFGRAIDAAVQNPFYQAILKIPKNLRVIADNVRMSEMAVPGEQAVRKQLLEIEQLKMSAPVPNPAFMEVAGDLADHITQGGDVPPEMKQQVESIPKQIPSINVATDASEDHPVEAMTCFEWMNDEEGQKFKNGTAEQQAGFENVHLHWQAHNEMAEKLTKQPAPPPIPQVRIGMKDLPPAGRTQAASKVGLQIPPKAFADQDLIDTQHKIAQKVVPKTVPETYRKLGR